MRYAVRWAVVLIVLSVGLWFSFAELSDVNDSMRAATLAVLASSMIFVHFAPHEYAGRVVQGATGGYLAFSSGWSWIQSELDSLLMPTPMLLVAVLAALVITLCPFFNHRPDR